MEIKKKENANIFLLRAMLLQLGLVIALVVIITAFQWETKISAIPICRLPMPDGIAYEDFLLVPNTAIPPPPKPILPTSTDVDDNELDKIKIYNTSHYAKIIDSPELELLAEEIDEELDEEPEIPVCRFGITEPSPNGGYEAFMKFLQSNLRYPPQAIASHIEGKVFVQFEVLTNGELSDIKIIKGIGHGCDQEALRVLNLTSKWIPGNSQGIPIKLRMIVPITFKIV